MTNMQLNSRQERIVRLAGILGTGKPVSSAYIITELNCSEPTLTRALKALRETWSAQIQYNKSTHTYQLVARGLLDKKTLRQLADTLDSSAKMKADLPEYRVILAKNKKNTISLSLRTSVVRKLDRLARVTGKTRSEAVELLATQLTEEAIKKYSEKHNE